MSVMIILDVAFIREIRVSFKTWRKKMMSTHNNKKNQEYIKDLYKRIDVWAIQFETAGSIIYEYYTESKAEGTNYVIARIGSANTLFDKAAASEKRKGMVLMAELYALEMRKPKGEESLLEEVNKNFRYPDKEGRLHIAWDVVYNYLLEHFIYKTPKETQQPKVFEDGIYVDAEIQIKQGLNEILGYEINSYKISEIIKYLARNSFVCLDDFDSDLGYIPMLNGLVNLKTGKLEAFDSEKMFTQALPVMYDPDASTEPIEAFVYSVVHSEDVKCIQEIYGYTLYLGYPAAKLFWFNGNGRNGKSTVMNFLKEILGEDGFSNVDLSSLDGLHRFSLARMIGKRLNISSEPGTNRTMETELMKKLTGGDSVDAEIKGVQKVVTFTNHAKMIVAGNNPPEIKDSSVGFNSRLLVIGFPNSFEDNNANPDFVPEFVAEYGNAGIFNWALEGLDRLRSNNWIFSGSRWQDEAKATMLRKSQSVKQFVAEWTEASQQDALEEDKLFEYFGKWCIKYKVRSMPRLRFIQEMNMIDVVYRSRDWIDKAQVYRFHGIKIKDSIEAMIILDSLSVEFSPEKTSLEDIDQAAGSA